MAVDVVVVNYKTYPLLQDFIQSYQENKIPGCTLTVVDVEADNRSLMGPYVDDIHTVRENIGYARACNLGARDGENDVILLANADTRLTQGLRACYEALIQNEDWGILGPRQVDDSYRITAGGIFGTEQDIRQRGWQEPDTGQYSDVREDAKSVSGSLYFIKRKLWRELTDCQYMQAAYPGIEGAFIPSPHYWEETCCSYHARGHGYKVVYYGPVQMVHLWHKASPIGSSVDRQERGKIMMREFLGSHGIICE